MLNNKKGGEKVKFKKHINYCLKSFITQSNIKSIKFEWRLKTILTKQKIL